ncbi:MAG: hypothetical protein K2N64_06405 [Anaeroplasmataceae bacterium]|nr:hypothetical protein [Anaeroplasmataceae bacterium]
MEIVRIENDPFLNEKSIALGNCYKVNVKNQSYFYEFIIKGNYATIECSCPLFLEEVVKQHQLEHKWVTEYRSETYGFYMSFEEIHTFKLPISILQVSNVFLNQKKLDQITKYEELVHYPVPVAIIEDEYVILNGHHQIFLAKELGYKMIDVYLDKPKGLIYDYIYLAKEQNIKTVCDMKKISNEEYTSLKQQLDDLFSYNK